MADEIFELMGDDVSEILAAVGDRKVVVYGAGSAGERLIKLFQQRDVPISCCVDKND